MEVEVEKSRHLMHTKAASYLQNNCTLNLRTGYFSLIRTGERQNYAVKVVSNVARYWTPFMQICSVLG
jgi:nucleosome binding factor SPN SPT16 subunit